MHSFSRLFFIAGVVVLLGITLSSAQDEAEILEHTVVYGNPRAYTAWPSMMRAENGDLIATFCRSEEHLGPDGEVVLVRSTDNGQTWSDPTVILDTPIDDRHAGLTPLRDGRIMAHFTCTHWTPEAYEELHPAAYPAGIIAKWLQHVRQPEYVNAKRYHGSWVAVSDDFGRTWSELRSGPSSIHGGIHLEDGSVLVPTYRGYEGHVALHRAPSPDDPFEELAVVECPVSDRLRFGEPHIVQLESGQILMMIRATARPYDDSSRLSYLHMSVSDDLGKTWSDVEPTPLWGYPPHLLKLSDGRILVSYGHRRAAFGQRACVSEDGLTWNPDDEVVLRKDAWNKDLGYPTSVELEPGTIMTLYYQPDPAEGPVDMHPPQPDRSRPDIRATIWRLPARESTQ
jgi:hypothetical protein